MKGEYDRMDWKERGDGNQGDKKPDEGKRQRRGRSEIGRSKGKGVKKEERRNERQRERWDFGRERNRMDGFMYRRLYNRSQHLVMKRTVLHYIVLYCAVLYCTVLYCTASYVVLCCTTLYCTVLCRDVTHVQTFTQSVHTSSQTAHLLSLTLHWLSIKRMNNRNIEISRVVHVRRASYRRTNLFSPTHCERLCDVEHSLLPVGVLRVWGGGEDNRLVYLNNGKVEIMGRAS